jgi:hypothetical protein
VDVTINQGLKGGIVWMLMSWAHHETWTDFIVLWPGTDDETKHLQWVQCKTNHPQWVQCKNNRLQWVQCISNRLQEVQCMTNRLQEVRCMTNRLKKSGVWPNSSSESSASAIACRKSTAWPIASKKSGVSPIASSEKFRRGRLTASSDTLSSRSKSPSPSRSNTPSYTNSSQSKTPTKFRTQPLRFFTRTVSPKFSLSRSATPGSYRSITASVSPFDTRVAAVTPDELQQAIHEIAGFNGRWPLTSWNCRPWEQICGEKPLTIAIDNVPFEHRREMHLIE